MALEAWAVDELKSDAKVIRNALGALIASAGGLVAAGGLELTQKGTPNMSVQIKGGIPAEGGLFIPGYTAATGPYFFHNTATYEQVIEAAGASNPRVDTIVARMYDTAVDSSGKHEPVFQALRGAEEPGVKLEGNKSKGLAVVPKNCYVLGYVLVPAKAASIVTADIENVATPMQLGPAGSSPVSPLSISLTGQTGRALNTKYLPSASRPVLVTVWAILAEPFEGELLRNGNKLGPIRGGLAEGGKEMTLWAPFMCNAGEEWELKKVTGNVLQVASFQAVL
jgi:hypothetical protein